MKRYNPSEPKHQSLKLQAGKERNNSKDIKEF